MSFTNNLGNSFAGGALGGLANALVVWLAGAAGITHALGVAIAPALSPAMVYQRMVWGGIWGLLFVLPILRGSIFWRGLVFSLGPTAVQLLVVFPHVADKGLYGMELGALTPGFVVLFNAVWGWVAAAWLKTAGR
ncbi:MAG: hypothetical protein KKC30_12135 [Proteobacteria bacterium]|nr:hypothetical protein [Pseudomonadota bacterium]MBU4277481.1 hypothetical protein [Pseudomonadota bacterium]MBU4384453.1 hypothetical protein [Pseudomonadota bacterium]MBU4603898.1 hypothetical protein [Pseudomonadota bacterium]MCG2766397.1 hypothetical protein [Desulfarculaceae bacterium]